MDGCIIVLKHNAKEERVRARLLFLIVVGARGSRDRYIGGSNTEKMIYGILLKKVSCMYNCGRVHSVILIRV